MDAHARGVAWFGVMSFLIMVAPLPLGIAALGVAMVLILAAALVWGLFACCTLSHPTNDINSERKQCIYLIT